MLVSASAVGYYGPHGDEPVTEETPPGDDFLAGICVAWEREAAAAEELGMRVVRLRTGVVLDRGGGALAKMLPFFKLGIGGPVAGGRQRLPWIHVDDLVGMYLAALDEARLDRCRQRDRARSADQHDVQPGARPRAAPPRVRAGPRLRRPHALRRDGRHRRHRPASGARSGPLALGFRFAHPDLDEALGAALEG